VRSARVFTCGFGDGTDQGWLNSIFSQLQAAAYACAEVRKKQFAIEDYFLLAISGSVQRTDKK